MTAETPIQIPVETRFPVDLALSIAPINRLYEESKRDTWSPAKDVPWPAFDPSAFSEQQRAAGRLVWSRRAWIEYSGIAETPALLIRFCLERGREADPKYFLTVRNTEEAELVEAFHQYAESLGGYHPRPSNPAWEAVFNRGYYRDALNAALSVDAYVAVHCAFEDGLELALFRTYLANAREAVARLVLGKSVEDKIRHAEFGWQYLERRTRQLSAADREATAHAIAAWVRDVAFSGYHVPSLSSAIDARGERSAQATAALAGLGAATAAEEEQVVRDYFGQARARLTSLGFALPELRHPRLGAL